jgi:hypothetical protein
LYEGAVYAVELALVFGVAIHGGEFGSSGDAPPKAAFCQSNRRSLHTEIFRSDAAL